MLYEVITKVLPVAGLEVLDADIEHLVRNRPHPVLILCDAVEGKHDKEGLIVEFLKGCKDILPAGIVCVFPGAAGPS